MLIECLQNDTDTHFISSLQQSSVVDTIKTHFTDGETEAKQN